MSSKTAIWFWICFLQANLFCQLVYAAAILKSNPLLVISLDGFRPDYVHPKLTPFLNKLAKENVHATQMKSVYVTKTFPNHYSIATGRLKLAWLVFN